MKAKLDGSGSRNLDIAVPHGDHNHNYSVELASTGYLPRIAPARVGADLRWSKDGWRASVGAVRYSRQKDVAQNEAEQRLHPGRRAPGLPLGSQRQ